MSKLVENSKPIFTDFSGNVDNDSPVTEVESVCMNCYKNGTTKLILTRIPFYKDIILSSFECEHCHYKNNEIQSANKMADHGVILNLIVENEQDLNREVIKSDSANLKIPEIDFEIQEGTQKAYLTTVEGILNRIKENIETDIILKKPLDAQLGEKLEEFLGKLIEIISLKRSFHIIINDPSGDSFIQNPNAPKRDEKLQITQFKRTSEQNELLGINTDESEADRQLIDNEGISKDEIIKFINNCPNCNAVCDTNMKLTEIPYFKTIIVMCTVCDNCGHRTNEVKSGTGISEKAKKYILKLTDPSDLNRDILKSETATVEIPEIEFFMNCGTLGGKFTTIEGLIKDCKDQLYSTNPFFSGDSSSNGYKSKMEEFLVKLDDILSGKKLNVTLILDDPSGNSYLQNVYAPEADPNLEIIEYERSFEQNEDLGLNDMKTENYENKD